MPDRMSGIWNNEKPPKSKSDPDWGWEFSGARGGPHVRRVPTAPRNEESHQSRDCHHDSRTLTSLVAGRKMPLVLEDRTLHVTQDPTVPRWSSECQVVLPHHVCSVSSEWLGLWALQDIARTPGAQQTSMSPIPGLLPAPPPAETCGVSRTARLSGLRRGARDGSSQACSHTPACLRSR